MEGHTPANAVVSAQGAERDRLAAELAAAQALNRSQAQLIELLLGRASDEIATALADEIAVRSRAEADLRTSEARFRLVWEHAHDAMVLVDRDGTVLLCNPAYCRLYGFAEQELVGRSFAIVFAPENQEAARQSLRMAFEGPAPGGTVELDVVRRDGTRVRADASSSFIVRDGERVAMLAIIRDVSERREVERRLQEALRMESVGLLAGGVAHEFNNILLALLGHAELLRMDLPAGSPAWASAGEIIAGARRAASLTSQLLAYAGKGRYQVRPLQLSALIAGMAELLSVAAGPERRVEFRLAEGLPPVRADDSQLRQVLQSLLTNAAEATDEMSGPIIVATGLAELSAADLSAMARASEAAPGCYVRLQVRDHGHGMDAESLARIYEPFFSTRFTGRGLGLPAVLGVVRGHGGAMRVASAPGEGTTVDIFLPAAAADRDASAGPAASRTLLLIDDEEQVRQVVQRQLERLGFRVLPAGDGDGGLAALRAASAPPAAALVDLTLPGRDGIAVARELRAEAPGLPILLISGYRADEVAAGSIGSPPLAFLQKPFTLADLRAALDAAIGPA